MSPSDGLGGFVSRLSGRRPADEDERLVALFRNRAELKKELAALDEEHYRLLDRLKLQEGATMRVEEQLDALQRYLGRPEHGSKCLAYFLLRAVWQAAAKRLLKFSEELAAQQQERERRQQLADFESGRRAQLGDLDRDLLEARVLADQVQAEQKLAQQRLAALRGFWNFHRRRTLGTEIEERRVRIEGALQQVADHATQRAQIEARPQPGFPGLGLEGRRAINLAVIAWAEWLRAQFAAGSLAGLAREAMLHRVYDTDYGDRDACLQLMQLATQALSDIERGRDDLAEIKTRTDRMRRSARYRRAEDAIPVSDSILPAGQPLNVLREEYWELPKALIR